MSTYQSLKDASEHLEFFATLNGRTATSVTVYRKGERETPLWQDDGNLSDPKVRESILANLSAETHAGVKEALLRLAAAVNALRSQPQQAKDTKPAKDEPWPSEVDGPMLLAEVIMCLNRYLIFPNEFARSAVALWIFLTHVHDASDFSPLLIITSPTRGSGKTRVLEVVQLFVPDPWMNLHPSDAVLYRKIDADHPTLLVDEMDNTNWRERPALVAILNGGFSKSGAVVPRCVGEDFEAKDFSVWAPKALATKGLKGIPDTTRSRSVIIHMKRRTRQEQVIRFRERQARLESAPVRSKLARWAADHLQALAGADPTMPEAISDRAADAWTPLVAIADAISADWGKQARKAAVKLSGSEIEAQDIAERLLADIRDILQPVHPKTGTWLPAVDAIFSADLVRSLKEIDGAPWADWGRGKGGLSTAQLADLLDPFGIGPKQIWRDGTNRRGYELAQFADAFARNLGSDARALDHAENQRLSTDVTPLVLRVPSASDSAHKSFNLTASSALASEEHERGNETEGPAPELLSDGINCWHPCPHTRDPDCPSPPKPWKAADGLFYCGVCHPNVEIAVLSEIEDPDEAARAAMAEGA